MSSEASSEKAEEKPKVDVSKLVAVVPPASEVLGKKQKQLTEKRVRIRFDRSLNKPIAKVPTKLAEELGIKKDDLVEIVVAGKKKARFTAELIDSPDANIVWVYPGELEKQGVADNSIATIRRAAS
ncbi:MAG: hypothetical protein ACP5KA_01610 [Desulfurococcaceae archaeon]